MKDYLIEFLQNLEKSMKQSHDDVASFLAGLTGQNMGNQPARGAPSDMVFIAQRGIFKLYGHKTGEKPSCESIQTQQTKLIVNSGTANKEVTDCVPQLKYGQGSIKKVERKNKNGTVYKYWQARYMCAGKQMTITAKTAEECMARLREAKKNIPTVPRKTSAKSGSLAVWVSEWFEKYRRAKVKSSTAKTYERVISVLMSSKIGAIALREVRTEHLQDYLMSIPQANTRCKTFDILNSALKKAVALDKIRKNPMELVEIPNAKSKPRRSYSFEEQNKMIKTLPERYSAVFRFLCCTGMRIGEFVALTNESVDKHRHLIWVTESIGANDSERSTPKTDSRFVQYHIWTICLTILCWEVIRMTVSKKRFAMP